MRALSHSRGTSADPLRERVPAPRSRGPTVEPARPRPVPAAAFESILYEKGAPRMPREAPAYFDDLALDQIVDAITSGRDEYDLAPFFHHALDSADAIGYRHEVIRDLERPGVLQAVTEFAAAFRRMRARREHGERISDDLQQQRWFLHAAETYCAAVRELGERLANAELRSRGMLGFRRHLSSYLTTERFRGLVRDIERVNAMLAEIRYSVLIEGSGFTVRRYDGERDYGVEIVRTFARFAHGEAQRHAADSPSTGRLSPVEAKILELVARLHPQEFAALARFREAQRSHVDAKIERFDREVQFYVAYIEYVAGLKKRGLEFSLPSFSTAGGGIDVERGFDLALAKKLALADERVVANDFSLRGAERLLIVSGPNQGGKTTFARAFGQIHHLAVIGCPVPARAARVLLFDTMFTHFERAEAIETLRGKLMDELVRIRAILERAGPRSIVIMNEMFGSTTMRDAVALARIVLDRLRASDATGVCVTFLEELASLGEHTVSMVGTVDPDDPAVRTFAIVRRPADGRAYATAIARKHRLTNELVRARIDERAGRARSPRTPRP